MGKKEKKKVTWGEWFIFYFGILAALCVLLSAVPAVPWRSARVDTNVGNRFAMERYYYLTGASDQFGKTVSWSSLKTKFQRKTEEFGRPSPLTALMGTAASMAGGAGPAMGCALWTACKDHVNVRYMSYYSTLMMGYATMAFQFVSTLCQIATILFMSFEEGSEKKKKKKKSDEETLSPKGKTMTAAIFAFLFSLMGTCTFMMGLDGTLKKFKATAYYPYAATTGGGFLAGIGCWLQWVCVMVAINRVTPFCGKKKDDDDEDGEEAGGDPYGKGGYGAYGKGDGKGKGWP